MASEQTPMEFGRYRLTAVIRQGGMGTVYRARDTLLNRDVAVKVLAPQLADEPGYRERFRREAQAVARLTEPHIIPIYDTGEVDGRLFLVMPIIEGSNLAEVLHRDGPMPPARTVHIIEQLAAALDAAHATGLVHRDVKPSNALLTGRDFAYLIDFGVARDATSTKLTSTGMIVGTLAYLAPERFTGGAADARGDVYALACVLHECLTGSQPYPGNSMEQQITGHLTGDPPRPSWIHPGIPVSFDAVVATGMAKNPDQRYQRAEDLVAAARRALTAQAHPAGAPTVFAAAQPAPVAPGQPWPTYGPPGPVPARRGVGLRVAAFVALALVAVLVGVITALVTGDDGDAAAASSRTARSGPSSLTPPNAPPVTEGALRGLLLAPAVADSLLGVTGFHVTEDFDKLESGPPSAVITPPQCHAVLSGQDETTYAGSGFTAVRGNHLNTQAPPEGGGTTGIDQYLVLFPSAAQAYQYFSTAISTWSGCANTTVKISDPEPNPDHPDRFWPIGPLTNAGETLSCAVERKFQDGSVLTQRALAVANNVIVDIWAGGLRDDNTNVAGQIATRIASQVPTS